MQTPTDNLYFKLYNWMLLDAGLTNNEAVILAQINTYHEMKGVARLSHSRINKYIGRNSIKPTINKLVELGYITVGSVSRVGTHYYSTNKTRELCKYEDTPKQGSTPKGDNPICVTKQGTLNSDYPKKGTLYRECHMCHYLGKPICVTISGNRNNTDKENNNINPSLSNESNPNTVPTEPTAQNNTGYEMMNDLKGLI